MDKLFELSADQFAFAMFILVFLLPACAGVVGVAWVEYEMKKRKGGAK